MRFIADLLSLIALLTIVLPFSVNAASIDSATLRAWDEYVETRNLALEQRLTPDKGFLWADDAPERIARIRNGEILITPVDPQNPKRVPSGLIHDWIGAAFIPDVTLPDLVHVLRDYTRYREWYPPNVIDSKAVSASEAKDRFSLLILGKTFFTKTALDIECESRYVALNDRRGYSTTRIMRIREVKESGSSQHTLEDGEGSGLIWRILIIARYLERDGGVYLEVEAIGLSRDIPGPLRWLVEPIIRRVSRETLSTSLRQAAHAVRARAELGGTKLEVEHRIAGTSK